MELDESNLIKDIESGKYPLVRFFTPSDVISKRLDGVLITKTLDVKDVNDKSLTELVFRNDALVSMLMIYRLKTDPYWYKNQKVYNPIDFSPSERKIKYLRVAIIPLSHYEIASILIEAEKNYKPPIKTNYKLLLIN